LSTNDSSQETSVEELPETCTDFKVRKETTISHYEVADGLGNSWWEAIFYTENWGTFKSAVQRYCGFNCTPYKDDLAELTKRLAEKGVKALVSMDNYRLILRINKSDIRVDYAFKNRGRSAAKKSVGELG